MKYCKDTTLTHSLAVRYPLETELLKDIFRTEGGSGRLFQYEKAINLDKIEKEQSSDASRTVDFTMGISYEGRNKQMMLVELKFNMKHPSNLGKTEIEEKINHSKILLTNILPVHQDTIFIFKNNYIQQAKTHIKRLYGKNLYIKVMSEQEFKTEYF